MQTLQQLYAINDAQRFPSFGPTDAPRASTLFYADFKVAEAFGTRALRDTYRNCGDLRTRDPKEVTELAVVANHLMWEAHDHGNDTLLKFYREIWDECNAAAYGDDSTWTKAYRRHFFQVTD